MAPPKDLERLKARVLALAAAEPISPRAERRPAADAGLALLALAAMGAVVWAAGCTAHAAGRPAGVSAAVIGGMAALAAAATWAVLPARRSMLGRNRGRLLAVAVGVPLVAALWLAAWHGAYVDPVQRHGLRCFALTAATAPWPLAFLAHLSRRFEPRHPALAGAALGSAAGAWAAAMVELWCPLADPVHVARGHVLPLVLLAALGAWVGRRTFADVRRRAAPAR